MGSLIFLVQVRKAANGDNKPGVPAGVTVSTVSLVGTAGNKRNASTSSCSHSRGSGYRQ